VARITRVMRQPKGNVLLLGVGGSGRQSLTRLATFMCDYKISQIEITKGFGMSEWREALKEVLLLAGIKAQPVVFLFSDTQIVFESMLEDINNVLNTGDVPNIYAVEDMDNIMTTCKQDCVRKRIQPTKLNIFAQFIQRVMANIHLVLCMSPLGEAFRTRLRKFPSIVNCGRAASRVCSPPRPAPPPRAPARNPRAPQAARSTGSRSGPRRRSSPSRRGP
jgi:dynein heavy chain